MCCCAQLLWMEFHSCDCMVYSRMRFPLCSAAARLSSCCVFWSSAPRLLRFLSHCTCWCSYGEVSCEFPLLPCVCRNGITINKLYFVLEQAVSGAVGVLWKSVGLRLSESDIPFVLLDSLLHRSPSSADVDAPAHTSNAVDYAILFSRV